MCGFVGGTLQSDRYVQAANRLQHRGPDALGIWSDDRVTLGFRRLAVIDIDPRSNQPMVSPDGTVAMVFNGEIYGFRDLKSTLEHHGYQFKTESDTEVLLYAYLQWGAHFVDRIDGMFAIAIYDQRSQQITLWRDRVGIKPLYYFWNQKHFVFASELKAIQELLENQLQPNLEAYYDFLTYHAIPAPKTGFKNVFQLRPAHSIQFDLTNQRLSVPSRYWELNVEPDHRMTFEDAQEQLRELLSRSVRDQLIADVPVGCFLSGGVDSSILAYEGARATSKLKTFSMGFEGEPSELPYAREVANHLGTEHYESELPATAIDFNKLKEWFDEPFGDTSAFPTHAVAAAARQHVTVALAGDGGDELFGGYRRYFQYSNINLHLSHAFTWWERRKSHLLVHGNLRKGIDSVSYALAPPLERYLFLMSGLSREEKQPYVKSLGVSKDYDDLWAWREYWRPSLPIRTRMQFLDFHQYLQYDLLPKVDRVSMAVSLEVRVPFLAKSVIELAFSVPESLRFRTGPKGLLRRTYEGCLPSALLNRPKHGFGLPAGFRRFDLRKLGCVILNESFDIPYPETFPVGNGAGRSGGVACHRG